ncbi:MAG: hypothetical protein ABSB82_17310 [Terriglobia bacterium]|jgi:hypothetical protein
MAFIRKRGQSFYLVHNVRKKGRVQQLHLARLGPRPRISESVIEGVKSRHPFVRVDWEGLKEKAWRDVVQPFSNDSQYLRDLLAQIHNLHMDLADLPLPALELWRDRELVSQMVSGLKLLRSTLDVKLSQIRKGRSMPFRN